MLCQPDKKIRALLFLGLAAMAVGVRGQEKSVRATPAERVAASLAKGKHSEALSIYDAVVANSRTPDVGLLRLIALDELKRIFAAQSGQPLGFKASERLAMAGDGAAIAHLRATAASSDSARAAESLAATISLVRIGRSDLQPNLARMLGGASHDDRQSILRTLEAVSARAHADSVARLLNDADPQVRAAAARTIGRLGYQAAVPRLKVMFAEDVAVVKVFAAVALKRLGERAADDYLAKLLDSSVGEVRLLAAEAYGPSDGSDWIRRVRELEGDQNPQLRLRVAERLICCDRARAHRILTDALQSPILPLRAEAASLLEETALADAATARRMLGDPSQQVTVHGAGAAIQLSKKSARQK